MALIIGVGVICAILGVALSLHAIGRIIRLTWQRAKEFWRG